MMSDVAALLRWAAPPFEEKARHSWSSLAVFLLPLPLLLLQVHLWARYDPTKTLPLRVALIPPIVWLAIPTAFSRYFDLDGSGQVRGQAQNFNFAAGVYSFYVILRALEWGTRRTRPRLKRAASRQAASANGIAKQNGHHANAGRDAKRDRTKQDEPLPLLFPGTWTPIELDLLQNMRGIGWESGTPKGPPALPVRQHTYGDRLGWALARLPGLIGTYTALDALAVVVRDQRVFPHIATVPGTSIWTAPPGLFRGAGPYVLTAVFGSMVYLVIQSHQALLSIVAVLCLGDLPSRWYPLMFDAPARATSVQDLWSVRWHHLFRQPFLHVGFVPARWLVKPLLGTKVARAAGVMAVFALSALMHDYGQANMVADSQWRMTQTGVFFLLQGVAVLLEQAWQDVTGRRVRGFYGWIWTMGFLILTGTMPTDEWTRRGLALSWVFTPKYTRPVVDRLVNLAVTFFV
ncbi:hypothetical protein ACQY0O_001249 [Thecaphora frezii]